MKRLLLLALVGALLLSTAPILAEDSFYVIGGRYTPGTRITSLPYTINSPGYYYLTGNLTYSGGNGITVNADNVTLDLMGFTLSGPAAGNPYGIYTTKNNLEVRNGTITGWYFGIVQNNPGPSTPAIGARAIGVRAVGNTYGIRLRGKALIKGCTASPGSITTGYGLGVDSGTISGCTVMDFSPSDSTTGQIFVGGGGRASDNLVLNCNSTGIRTAGITTVTGNCVIECKNGIDLSGGGSLVANTVSAASGQTALIFNNTLVAADQNTFYLNGAAFSSGTFVGQWGLNGGGAP